MKKETTTPFLEWELLAKKIEGTLTEAEETEFMQWLLADVAHRRYYEKAFLAWSPGSIMPIPDLEEVITEFDALIDAKEKNQKALSKKPRRYTLHRRSSALFSLLKIAAMLAFVVVSYFAIDRAFQIKTPFPKEEPAQYPHWDSDENKHFATLVLSNGTKILLDTLSDGKYNISPAIRLKREGNTLSYICANNQASNQLNTLFVPRGQHYTLRLADGSKVSINSESTITYPIGFASQSRRLQLDGEAFFDVIKSHVPFEVITDKADIKVYGTSFNVCAYSSEEIFSTSLISGSVGIRCNEKEYRLKSGEEARIHASNKEVKILNANTYANCSWMTETLIFENADLQSVTKKIERLYDVNIKLSDPDLHNLHFTGDFQKSEGLQRFLSVLEKVFDLSIQQNAHNIILHKKHKVKQT